MRDHWHKHRGFVKAHVAVDVLEARCARRHRHQESSSRCSIRPHDNFDVLRNKGIEAGIRTAHDASMRTSGHTFARSMAVKKEGAW